MATKIKITLTFFLAMFLIMGCTAADTAPSAVPSSPKLIEVDSNLDAAELKPGDVYGIDFVMEENYMSFSVKTIMLESIILYRSTVRYIRPSDPSDFTQYFAWVCYPQICKDSRATVIFLEDVGWTEKKSGDFTVRAVSRIDTTRALMEFGGTYGTKQKGW